jgi:glycosyltransferase involved in cell wall biosynthesis
VTPLLVVHVARNPHTGVWSVIKELVRSQRARGCDVRLALLVSSDWPHRREASALLDRVTFTWSPKAPGTAALAYHELRSEGDRFSRVLPPNAVLHYHDAWMSGAFLPSLESRARRCVITFHGVPRQDFLATKPLRRWLHRRWAARVRSSPCILVSVDRRSTDNAARTFGIPASSFVVIPNGIADPGLDGCPRLRGEQCLTIGHVGSLHPSKGWRVVAASARVLHARGVPVRLRIAGGGSPTEEAAAAACCSEIGRGSTFHGLVENAAVRVMPLLDVLVLASSHHEGMPMAILEALSQSVPVIATRIGGIPEIVRDGQEGFLVDAPDPGIISEKLLLIAEDRDLLRSLGQAARRRYLENYQTERMTQAYERLYYSVC